MSYTIVSGNKPSSVALNVHQNRPIVHVFIEMFKKMPSFNLNLKMPKSKWDGAEILKK